MDVTRIDRKYIIFNLNMPDFLNPMLYSSIWSLLMYFISKDKSDINIEQYRNLQRQNTAIRERNLELLNDFIGQRRRMNRFRIPAREIIQMQI